MKNLFFLFTILLVTESFANNPGVSYQGRIFKPDGNPLDGTRVQFRLQVRSPGSENCLLYEEVQALNMAGSSGIFSITMNDGTGTRLDTATYQVDRIFANRGTMTLDATRCATGTDYTPNSSDGRKLIVYFKDETMSAYEAMPIMNLNYVPQAMYALEAQKVGPFAVTNLLRAVDGSGNPVAAPAFDPAQLTNLNSLVAGTSTQYATTTAFNTVQTFAKTALPTCVGGEVLKSNGTVFSCVTDSTGGGGGTVTDVTSTNSYLSISTSTSTPALTLNVGTAVNTVAAGNDSRISGALQSGATAGGSLSGTYPNPTVAAGSITNTEISGTAAIVDSKLATISTAGKVSGSAITSGTIGGSTLINTSGNIQTTGSLRLYDAGPTNSVSLKAPTSVTTSYNLVFPDAKPLVAGYILAGDTSGNLTWVAPNSGSVTSVTATAPMASTGGATPVISLSQANTTTAGYLSSADWNTFNNKQSTSLANGSILVGNGSNIATAVAPASDVAMTNAGAFTVTKIQGSAVSSTTPSTAGQVLRYSGTQWVPNFISMFDLRSTITGAATFAAGCTSGQTLTWTSATDNLSCTNIAINDSQLSNTVSRTANTFLAAPNGSAGAATYRGIASADLPSISSGLTGTLPAASGGTGQSTYAVGDLLYASTTSALSKLPASTSGYVLTSGGSGVAPSWAVAPSGPLSGLTAAGGTNGINNSNFAQTWNWNSATTENPMTLTSNALTTGSLLSLTTSSASINSTNGLLNVANSTATTAGILARFQANSTAGSGMTMLNSGNVGVGTTTPQANLHVKATANTNGVVEFDKDSGLNGGYLFLNDIQYGANTRYDINFSTGGSYRAKITGGQDGSAASYLALSTTAEAMRINSAGNVGIGTTNPTRPLSVSNNYNGNVVGEFLNTGSAASSYSLLDVGQTAAANGVAAVRMYNSASAWMVGIDGANSNAFSISNSLDSAFSSTRFTMLTSGNVGIGTASPSAPLYVKKTGTGVNSIFESNCAGCASSLVVFNAAGTGSDTFSSIEFAVNNATNSYGAIRGYSTGGTTGELGFMTMSSGGSITEKMRVTQAGNVGIGTTSPQTALDVNGVIRVAKYAAQPFACDAAHDGSLALTSGYRHCVCKGGTTTWVFTSDGATSCIW